MILSNKDDKTHDKIEKFSLLKVATKSLRGQI